MVAWVNWEYLWKKPSVYASLIPKQKHQEQRRSDILETLMFLFVDVVEPIHCPLRMTCCLEVVCIATRRACGRSRIANLSLIHDNCIVGNHRTLRRPSGLGAAGSLRSGAKEAKNFPPHILRVDNDDISGNFDYHTSYQDGRAIDPRSTEPC